MVCRDLFERWDCEQPDATFLLFDDGGPDWSFAALHRLVRQTAIGLQEIGISQGDHVLVWLPNGRENVRLFFAINYIGAVYVPINTAYRGPLLSHAVALSKASVLIADAEYLPHLDATSRERLSTIIVVGQPHANDPGLLRYDEVLLPAGGSLRAPPRRIEPWDPQSLIFTSGTTGPSKAVLSSYLHLYSNAGPESWPMVTAADRFLNQYPLFHVGGTAILYGMLARGGSCVVAPRFDTATFWDTVARTRCTVAFLLGVMATFLCRQPESKHDRTHGLRKVFLVPLGDGVSTFGPRFGVDVYTIFNMTEVATPLRSGANPTHAGTCGSPREGVEVRLVDSNDCEVPAGVPGELIVRTDRPWAMNSGYFGDPAATAASWRNGWFHTGDVFRRDHDDNFYFVDRLKDAIRRRGENISSYEIEREALAHPLVREAAAVGVTSSDTEEEVLLCVAPIDGTSLSPSALIDFLDTRLPRFMVPRYIRVLPELPKTPSAKVIKTALRAEGVTETTWQRSSSADRRTRTIAPSRDQDR